MVKVGHDRTSGTAIGVNNTGHHQAMVESFMGCGWEFHTALYTVQKTRLCRRNFSAFFTRLHQPHSLHYYYCTCAFCCYAGSLCRSLQKLQYISSQAVFLATWEAITNDYGQKLVFPSLNYSCFHFSYCSSVASSNTWMLLQKFSTVSS